MKLWPRRKRTPQPKIKVGDRVKLRGVGRRSAIPNGSTGTVGGTYEGGGPRHGSAAPFLGPTGPGHTGTTWVLVKWDDPKLPTFLPHPEGQFTLIEEGE